MFLEEEIIWLQDVARGFVLFDQVDPFCAIDGTFNVIVPQLCRLSAFHLCRPFGLGAIA